MPSALSLLSGSEFFEIFLAWAARCSILRLRTNSAEMPGNRSQPGASTQGRRGGESESPEEEAIEIGNSRRHSHPAANDRSSAPEKVDSTHIVDPGRCPLLHGVGRS